MSIMAMCNPEQYEFNIYMCAVYKIIMENGPCTYDEIIDVAEDQLDDDKFELLKKNLHDVLSVGFYNDGLSYRHNVFSITEKGTKVYYHTLDDINWKDGYFIIKLKHVLNGSRRKFEECINK